MPVRPYRERLKEIERIAKNKKIRIETGRSREAAERATTFALS